MSLSSSSTLADALAQYNDNLSWEGDVTKATAALEAVRWLLINRAQTMAGGGQQLNYGSLENEKKKLEAFVSSASSAAAAARAGFVRAGARL